MAALAVGAPMSMEAGAPALPQLPGIKITSSEGILGADARMAQLIWAPSGYGKTVLAGQLNELTMKYLGKPTLYIACEAAEGGGAASIRKLGVPLYVPKTYEEADRTLRYLRNDKQYGGLVLDSSTEFYKQYIKAATLKYPSRENAPTRQVGVLTRSDYQVAGELTSQFFRNLIALTTLDNPEMRKHLIVTAADQSREEDEKVVWVGPDLPGRMSREAVQMFQQVGTLSLETKVLDGKRVAQRYLTFNADGVKALKDRYDIYPGKMLLKRPGSDEPGETLVSIYEKYWLSHLWRLTDERATPSVSASGPALVPRVQ